MAGVVAFATSGVLETKRRDLDGMGVITSACCTAVDGSVARDPLIGAVLVAALVDLWTMDLPVLTAVIVMLLVQAGRRLWIPLLLYDVVGLGLSTVDGVLKGPSLGLHPAAATLTGVVTGVGDGIPRDVLVSEVLLILRRHSSFYAVAALLGSGLIVWLSTMGRAGDAGIFGIMALILLIRMTGFRYGWYISNGCSRSRA